jgi:hypothetical protein
MIPSFSAWSPGRLYESMRYTYAIAGLVTIFYVDMLAGYVAGALLLLATLVIRMLRNDCRSSREASF